MQLGLGLVLAGADPGIWKGEAESSPSLRFHPLPFFLSPPSLSFPFPLTPPISPPLSFLSLPFPPLLSPSLPFLCPSPFPLP